MKSVQSPAGTGRKALRALTFGWLTCMVLVYSGCAGSNLGSAINGESLQMKVHEQKNILSVDRLKEQAVTPFVLRGAKGRGVEVTGITGSLVSMATDAVKSIIANEQKKYSAEYQFGLSDLYFYDQLSNSSPFEPTGLQFFGFKLIRTFKNTNGNIDTAFTAEFELDTSNNIEIINNAMFRLRLKSFQLNYAKAKVAAGGDKKLNMDFEISFVTSFADDKGKLYNDVTVGKFFLFIRQAPLDASAPGYKEYYDGLKGQLLQGRSFLIPRSIGYHLEEGEFKEGYSQGAYSINVSVKENSKNVFINKLLIENSNILIDEGRDNLQRSIINKLPPSMQ